MRADRLISILMLLQTHQSMTAAALAHELEVSQRTIYRDVTALGMAGVPIYTDRGPGGGIALLDSYRTTLTGINEDEARALFMLNIPTALVELGVSQELKMALLKMAVALPQSQREVAIQTQQRIFLDSTTWTPAEGHAAHLEILHQAVWKDKLLRVTFKGSFEAMIEIEIAPLGLVSKLNSWYLVGKAGGNIKVIKVQDIVEVHTLEKAFIREEDFDLEKIWADWCKEYRERRPAYPVRVKMEAEVVRKLPYYLGEAIKHKIILTDQGDTKKWVETIIYFDNHYQARQIILSLGRAVEVIEPEALRVSVIDYAEQIIDLYESLIHANAGIDHG